MKDEKTVREYARINEWSRAVRVFVFHSRMVCP